jgi:hypothetical protein
MSKAHKDIFIDTDEKLNQIRYLKLKAINVQSPSFVFNEDLSKSPVTLLPQAYFWLRNALIKNIKEIPDVDVQLDITYKGQDYIISYGKSQTPYPEELTGLFTSDNIDSILKYFIVLSTNKQSNEDLIKEILDYIFISGHTISRLPADIVKYFDVLNGSDTSIDNSIINSSVNSLKIELETRNKEFENYKSVVDNYNKELEAKERELQELVAAQNTSKVKIRNTRDISEDVESLTKVKESLDTLISEVTGTLTILDKAILDEMSAEYPHMGNLALYKEKKISFQESLTPNTRKRESVENDLLNLKDSLKQNDLPQEQATELYVSLLQKAVDDLNAKVNSCINQLQIISSDRDSIRKQLSSEESKLGDIQGIDSVNFVDVNSFLTKNVYISQDNLIIYNFIFSLILFYLQEEPTENSQIKVISLFRKIFSI